MKFSHELPSPVTKFHFVAKYVVTKLWYQSNIKNDQRLTTDYKQRNNNNDNIRTNKQNSYFSTDYVVWVHSTKYKLIRSKVHHNNQFNLFFLESTTSYTFKSSDSIVSPTPSETFGKETSKAHTILLS